MGLSWHFVDLSDAQKHERRILLDRYATIAQVSVIVPVLAVQLYFLACWIQIRRTRDDGFEKPGSPYLKEHFQRRSQTQKANELIRRVIWWAGEPIELFDSFVATNGEFLGAAAWTAWLLLLCGLQTSDGTYSLDP